MKTIQKKEWRVAALVLVTVVLTTAAWFGVKHLQGKSAVERDKERQSEAIENSKVIPVGVSADVAGVEVVDPEKDQTPVTEWLGTMEFTVTDAVLYENLEAFEASDESFYISDTSDFMWAISDGFTPSLLVVSVSITNKDAISAGAAESSSYSADYIGLGDFRVGIDNRVAPSSALTAVDVAVDPTSIYLNKTVSIPQGTTKQVKLAFFLIPKDNYDSVTASLTGDSRVVGNIEAIYEPYVYEEKVNLSLCLGWSHLALENNPQLKTIPYVFELAL